MRLPEPAVRAALAAVLPAFLCVATAGTPAPAAPATAYVGDSTSVQQLLDQAKAAGGGTVRLPAGRFLLDRPVEVPEGVCLAGAGARSAGLS